jgi:uncharacterized protein DUF1707
MAAAPESSYSRQLGPRDRRLRVGDRERESVAEILRREHVDGRLDAGEFHERLDRALAAKTYADLDTLIADLPADAREHRHAPSRLPRPWRFGFVALFALALIAATGGHILWLAFPLAAFFVLRTFAWRSGGGGRGYRGW